MSDPATPTSRRPPRERSGLLGAVGRLTAAQQRVAAASLVVLVSLGAPWYSTEVVFSGAAGQRPSVSRGSMTGIGAFSFVEAAVLLVAAAVLALVWARATERSFSLPISDGTVVTAAAGWLGVLIVYRLFDRPEGETSGQTVTLIGLSWGIFATLAAVGLLLATGLDQRRRDAEHRVVVGGGTAPPDAPVVDPADLVPVAGTGPGPSGAAGQDGPGAAGAGAPRQAGPGASGAGAGAAEPGARSDGPGLSPAGAAGSGAPAPTDGPRWDDPTRAVPPAATDLTAPWWGGAPAAGPADEAAPGSVGERPSWAGPATAPQGRRATPPPADPPRPSRSWSFDDPDAPEPAPPRSPPSQRRPTPPQDPTRPLGRGDAAQQLRDAGVGPAGPSDADPTRVVPGSEDRTDTTRVAPPQHDHPDATRVHPSQDGGPGAAQPPEGEGRSRRRRRRDRG